MKKIIFRPWWELKIKGRVLSHKSAQEEKMAEVLIKVPEGVHVVVARAARQDGWIALEELAYSHVLLPIRAHFGRDAKFKWINPQDWVKFCNGEEVRVLVLSVGIYTFVNIHHAGGRVVYISRVEAAVVR